MDTQKIVNRILEHPAFNKSNIENYDAEDFRQLINELVHEEDRSIQILEMTNETLNESLNTARSELEQLKLIINEETSSLSQEEENLLHLEHNINQTAANISSNRESIIEHQNNMEELLNFSELVTDFFNSFSEPYGLLIFFLSLYLLGKISKEILMEYKKFKEKKDK